MTTGQPKDRYICTVCPACSHSHDHDSCSTRLHGFAPMLIASGLHSFLNGWMLRRHSNRIWARRSCLELHYTRSPRASRWGDRAGDVDVEIAHDAEFGRTDTMAFARKRCSRVSLRCRWCAVESSLDLSQELSQCARLATLGLQNPAAN